MIKTLLAGQADFRRTRWLRDRGDRESFTPRPHTLTDGLCQGYILLFSSSSGGHLNALHTQRSERGVEKKSGYIFSGL